MTYFGEDGGEEVVPELRLSIEGDGDNEDYVKLRHGPDDCGDGSSSPTNRWHLSYWVRFFLLLGVLVVLAGVFIKWVRPFIIDKVGIFLIEFWKNANNTQILHPLLPHCLHCDMRLSYFSNMISDPFFI